MNTGWLSPDGEFIECGPRDHVNEADEIAEKLGIFDLTRSSDDVLLDNGWIRISFLTFFEHGYVFSFMKESATEYQKTFLEKYLNENRAFISDEGFRDLYYMGIITAEERDELLKD